MAVDFFSEEEKKAITDAIAEAENKTSGEIRLHVENHCKKDVLDRATDVFSVLEMHKTELRNGVLIYLATKDHKFAIIGDAGINQVVPENFWDNIKETMASDFKKGHFKDGVTKAIYSTGEQLKAHFPVQSDDINELSDDISYGE